jgi:hypothetical protein
MSLASTTLRLLVPRRHGLRSLMRLSLGAVLLLSTGSFAVPAGAQEARVIGDIGRVAGSVMLLRGAERLPASPGMALHEEDGIMTAAESKAEILIADGSIIVVGPDSTVSVAQFAPREGGAGRALIELISGILRVTLSGRTPWESFEVRSATAVASVRSTDWIVDASRVKTGVFVVEGQVAVAGRQVEEHVVLDPGEGTDVLLGRAPTPPKAWGQPRIDGVLARTSLP